MESSLREKPERHASRRLSDHLTFEGQKQKVHSLVDKVYARKNLRGWGHYYCRSQVRTRFRQLDGWIVRRLWSHRAERWRNAGWKKDPTPRLRADFKLVGLVSLIPSLQITKAHS